MFVRIKTTPNSPRKSVQIVENQRDRMTGKVKQKILRHVGIAMDEVEEQKLRQLAEEIIAKMIVHGEETAGQRCLPGFGPITEAQALEGIKRRTKKGRKPKKKLEDVLPTHQVSISDIVEEKRITDGIHEVFGSLYDDLGYGKVLARGKDQQILKDMVLSRIAAPASKHATQKNLQRSYERDHDLDSIYRTMDKVFAAIPKIKHLTFRQTQDLLPEPVSILLFDVTTLYFESTDEDELRRFGYSKDFRFNTTQVVLALASTTEGLPVGYELFEGNKAEVSTLISAIDSWSEFMKIEDVCFVGDRAMMSEDNLKAMEARGYKYIVACKLRALPAFMQHKILDTKRYVAAKSLEEDGDRGTEKKKDKKAAKKKADTQSEGDKFSIQEIRLTKEMYAEFKAEKSRTATQLKAYEEFQNNNKNRTFIVSHSSARAHHDATKRQRLVDKIETQLSTTSNAAKLIKHSGLKKYTSARGKSVVELDQAKIELDASWDGFHGVITNKTECEARGVLKTYRCLVKIEDCFRVNKSTLKMRPIFHFKPQRIHAHIAICFMAFAVLRQLEYRVKLTKKLELSPSRIIEELNSVQASIYRHKQTNDRYRVPGLLTHEARKIYEAMGIKRNLDAHPIL